MRVLHVIPAIAARYGGPGRVAIETVRALRAAGHDALIVATDADGDARLDVPIGRETVWQGVPIVVHRLGGGERFKWSTDLARWVRGNASTFDLADVHAVFSHSSVAAGRACRRAGIPYVIRPHGALDPWSLGRKSLRKRILFHLGIRRLLQHAAVIQYTTRAEQDGAERTLPWLPEGRVVPLGVNDDGFTSADDVQRGPEARPYVLALSRLDAKKNLDLLIEAFHAAASGPLGHWRLVIAGDGPPGHVAALRRQAAAGPAASRIEFPGWVSGEAKDALVSGAALLASPSAQENFGLSIAEAMARGVPVLVTPGVNLADTIASAGAGWIVAPDWNAIADALRSILDDRHVRQERGRAARELAETFRWSRSVDALTRVYEDVLATGRSDGHV